MLILRLHTELDTGAKLHSAGEHLEQGILKNESCELLGDGTRCEAELH